MRFTVVLILTLALSLPAIADEIMVTVYNSNLGVVTETRQLEFDQGVGRLAFRDVPSQIDAASVRFEVIGGGGDVAILEQNYAYDLISPDQMYAKYIDQEIELIDKDGRLYVGTLMAYSSGSVTLMENSGRIKIVRLENITEINFPELPEGLITRPTLFWLYRADGKGARDCKVGYQTRGLTWNAEYVGLLDSDEKFLSMSGWSSITNNSGKTYKDAKLKLVAGDIARARPEYARGRDKVMAMAVPEADGFQEKAFFEYHLYTLPRPATVANKEIKQISLFDPAQTPVEKTYTYRPDQHPTNVSVELEFINSEEAGMGMPLPAGRVRLFKADDDGSVILLGEDRIGHTPRDEKVKIRVGNAFDIVAEEVMTDQRRISQQVEERDFKVEIRNRKDADITVVVEKRFYGYWQILASDIEYTKKDANTVLFELPVTARKTAEFTYTVRLGQ